MKQLICDMCASTDIMKQDGFFVCQVCGMKYSVEEAKKMMIEGTVDVQGTVKVDNSSFVEKYLANARRARNKGDWAEVEKYYNLVEQNDPTNIEAIFYSTFAKVKSALFEPDTAEKRQSVFDILSKGVSIIDDHYNNANEAHEKLLFEIMDDIKGLKDGTIVPTTYLANYETTNGYGAVTNRSQIVEKSSLDITYKMIDGVFEAYMDSLANIIIAHSPETIKALLVENILLLPIDSKVHEKVAEIIDGYKTPLQAITEIVNVVKVEKDTKWGDIYHQIHALGKNICPMFMDGEVLLKNIDRKVWDELRKMHPKHKALKVPGCFGCYVATCVYGSYDCPEVWTLRRYRDNTLGSTWYGRAFIRTYYAISPTLVKWFGKTKWFKKMWKGTLDRMVQKLQDKGVENTPYDDIEW